MFGFTSAWFGAESADRIVDVVGDAVTEQRGGGVHPSFGVRGGRTVAERGGEPDR